MFSSYDICLSSSIKWIKFLRLNVLGWTVERSYGLLAKNLFIFQKAFETDMEMAECTIKSACVIYIIL
jgi:hypothetical protein